MIEMRAYKDPTADIAIKRVMQDEDRLNTVLAICHKAIRLGGFKLLRKIELVDVRGNNER